MKVLFDTSVLVAGMMQSHPHYAAAWPWLDAAMQGRVEAFVSCHSLAEFYRVLTSIRSVPPLTSVHVCQLIDDELLQWCQPVALSADDYTSCLQRLAQKHERGGIIFDALIIEAALKVGVDHVVTLNARHFERLWPNYTSQVINPLTTQAP